jgi:hypothetical protein
MTKTYEFDLKKPSVIIIRKQIPDSVYEINSATIKSRISDIDKNISALQAEKDELEIDLLEVQTKEDERNNKLKGTEEYNKQQDKQEIPLEERVRDKQQQK